MNAASPTTIPTGLARVRLWWEMTRPRVLLLVLFTGVPVLGMSAGGWPSLTTALAVLVPTALTGAACSTLNAWVERESDARMARTRQRPLPAAAVAPHEALGLGLVLSVVSTALLAWVGGPVAAGIGLGTILFYVLVYTVWLKPRTPQNIVIGGAAGATTPMIAQAVIDGYVGISSVFLFLLVFLWTPPHFWAIAIFRKREYEAAGFPMMPSVVGDAATRRQSMVYTVLMVLLSVIAVPLGLLGPGYGLIALLVGLWFIGSVWRSIRADDPAVDYGVFRASIVYLFLLCGGMLLDRALLAGLA